MSMSRKAGLLVGAISGAAMLATAAEGGEGGEGRRGRIFYAPPYYVGAPVVRQRPPVVIVQPPVVYAPPPVVYEPFYDAPASPSLNLNLNVPLR